MFVAFANDNRHCNDDRCLLLLLGEGLETQAAFKYRSESLASSCATSGETMH